MTESLPRRVSDLSGPTHQLVVARAPLMSGKWLVVVRCACGGADYDVVDDHATHEQVKQRLSCYTEVSALRYHLFGPAAADQIAALTGSSLVCRPDGQVRLHGRRHAPTLLAVDGSYRQDPRGAYVAWAAVTGSGWLRWGRYVGPRPRYVVQWAELRALIAGLELYPPGYRLRFLVDARDTERYVRAMQAGIDPRERRPWLSDEEHDQLDAHLRHKHVEVEWVRRNSTTMAYMAHKMASHAVSDEWTGEHPLLLWSNASAGGGR